MVAVAWKHKNVYIDTSAYDPKYYPEALIRFMKTTGRKKVLFGSNFPQLTLAQCTSHVDGLGLSPEVKELFLWKNAHSVFNLEKKPKL